MLEFLLKQSLSDLVFYENDDVITALEKYANSADDGTKLESFVFERLDLYLSQNLLFFESILFEKNWNEEIDDQGIAKKVASIVNKHSASADDYKNTKANVPKIKKKKSKIDGQKAKKIAKEDIKKLSKSNIIKRKLGIINIKKAIKDSIGKKIKSSKPVKKLKKYVGVKLKAAVKAHKAAYKQHKKSEKAYEKLVNSTDMKNKRAKLKEAVQNKRALKRKGIRRSARGKALLFTAKKLR